MQKRRLTILMMECRTLDYRQILEKQTNGIIQNRLTVLMIECRTVDYRYNVDQKYSALRALIPSSCGRLWALRANDGAFGPSPITQPMTPPYVYGFLGKLKINFHHFFGGGLKKPKSAYAVPENENFLQFFFYFFPTQND